jgi:hypothetical protein
VIAWRTAFLRNKEDEQNPEDHDDDDDDDDDDAENEREHSVGISRRRKEVRAFVFFWRGFENFFSCSHELIMYVVGASCADAPWWLKKRETHPADGKNCSWKRST